MLLFKKFATNFYIKPFQKRIRRRGKPKFYYAKFSKNFMSPPLDYRGFRYLTLRRSLFSVKYTKSLFLYFLFLVNPFVLIPNQVLFESLPICSILFFVTKWNSSFWKSLLHPFMPEFWSYPSLPLTYIFAPDFSLFFFYPGVWSFKEESHLRRSFEISSFAFESSNFSAQDHCDIAEFIPDRSSSWQIPAFSSNSGTLGVPSNLMQCRFLSFFTHFSFCYSRICSPQAFLSFLSFKFCLPFPNLCGFSFIQFLSILRWFFCINLIFLKPSTLTSFLYHINLVKLTKYGK